MGAVPSSQYDMERRRATWNSAKDEDFMQRRRRTYAAGTRLPSMKKLTSSTASTTGYITPYEVRQMMAKALDSGDSSPDPISSDHDEEEHEYVVEVTQGEYSPAEESTTEAVEAAGPRRTAKLSLASADSGLESESGGHSPRGEGSDDGEKEEEKKEKKRKISKIRRRARKISQRFRSRSITSLFNSSDKPAPLFGNSLLDREWEIVTVQEMRRRLDLDQLNIQDMPIPEGASASMILDELMIRQIMEILPARAEGYPWVPIYNSEKHGFSLATLYRKMAEFDEDMSPILLIIRDTREHVFGCVVSSAIRPADHFFGTGDSCLLWRFTGEVPHTRELRHYSWTGDNQFFVLAKKESLSIGAGHGHNGLWLDADLNHGRSQKCETFDNEPLSGDSEDFIVQFIEAFGFRM